MQRDSLTDRQAHRTAIVASYSWLSVFFVNLSSDWLISSPSDEIFAVSGRLRR